MRAIAKAIIRGMDACFGRKFRDQWDGREAWQTAMIEWAGACARFGLGGVTAALAALQASGREWPPSLPVFLGLLEDGVPKAAHQRYVALPKPTPDPEKAAAALAAMRRVVGR